MSASIAAAQRRRAGPPDTGRPGGGPRPSINSAQAFSSASQMQGQRPNMPTGKLAGQHAAQQQAMDRQQYAANQKANANNKQLVDENGNSKITVAQAITLITLRLGKLESAFYQLQLESAGLAGTTRGLGVDGLEESNLKLVDANVIDSIVARLESLEKRGTTSVSSSSSSSNQDVAVLKQQMDVIKPSIVTLKNASLSNTKDIKDLTNQMTSLFEEMNMLKAELSSLRESDPDFDQEQEPYELEEPLDGTNLDDLVVGDLGITNGTLDLKDLTM